MKSTFIDFEKQLIKQIVTDLTKIGTAAILLGKGGSRNISVQALCDTIMHHYGLASVPVLVSSAAEPPTHYDGKKRQIIIRLDDFKDLSDELKVYVVLHEARHAVQRNLIDNMLSQRRDGSPSFYHHQRLHDTVRKFPRDVERMLISSVARNFSSELLALSEEAQQTLYASQTSEKDADSFAAHIIAILMKRDSESILTDYRNSIGKEQLSSASSPQQKTTSGAIQTLQSSLILPSRENSWDAGSLREATLDVLGKNAPSTLPNDPYEHLLIGKPKPPENGKEEQTISDQLQRDPELYTRFSRSLAYQARMADFSTPQAIRQELPRLKALADDPVCGQNGLRMLAGRIREALDGSINLDGKLKSALAGVLKELELKNLEAPAKRETKAMIIKALTSREKVEIPADSRGSRLSLLDTCGELNSTFKKGQYLGMANQIRILEAHIDQGWLGEKPKQHAVQLVGEIAQDLKRIEQVDIRAMMRIRLRQAIKDLKTSRP